ncbi:ribonuclease H-like protein [Gloeophyllum trabeum ATCC 11539]|uniref:Ribonuclease H-like protein n=1 Tax=Gloeophyllum trabeum (strain ATCC 11539 / FP-39264 / Madison 617) TaxID=670483 RepID=S7PWN8_GLOTA|nr:ribonuclease H-like protein [Gloeophyllum trabeum ATCC 11539]EPQ51973.1 ribonuclease H-like protein [Gloeophyllum trabeum ATCC 11539]
MAYRGRPILLKSVTADINNSVGINAPTSTESVGTTVTKTTKASVTRGLPLYTYKDYSPKPCVVYTRNEEEADDLIQCLKGPLGFDMEWRVNRRWESRTALVQFCDEKIILLVQEVIESPKVLKMGANIHNDGKKLYRDFGIRASALLELGALAGTADPDFKQTYNRRIVALAKVVAMYEKKTLAKGDVRTSDWEAELDAEQQEYAASDAHCALMVYKRMMKIAEVQRLTVDPFELTTSVVATHVPPPVSRTTSTASTGTFSSTTTDPPSVLTGDGVPPQPMSPQWMRAYNLWHHKQMPLSGICARLRSPENPLKESTVISYVIRALQADPTLPYSVPRLKELVQQEASSWQRHRDWITQQEANSWNV